MFTPGNDFKQAMRRLASTIALVTSGSGDDRAGMAATAVISVTMDPPTLLIAVNKSASVHPVIMQTQAFCVNLLGSVHRAMVPIFSGKLQGAERFEHGSWRVSDSGLPVLTDAVSSIVCKVVNTVDVGSHSVFIGEVTEIDNHACIDPLLWVDGNMASVLAQDAVN